MVYSMDDCSKQKLLILAANGLGKTGVPNVIYQVVNALSGNFQIDVVVFNDDNFYSDKILSLGAKIIKVDNKEPKTFIKRFFWRFFKEKRIVDKSFKKLFFRNKYCAIHSFMEYDSAYIFKLAKKHNIAKRIIHCNNEIKPPKKFVSKLIYNRKKKLIKEYCTEVIAVSKKCGDVSYKDFNFFVIYNTFNEKIFNKKLDNLLEENDLVITQIATFSSRKNQLFTLSVLEKLLKLRPNVKLNLIGTEVESGYLEKIKNEICKMELCDSVKIIDGNKDFYKIIQHTTFMVLPSIHEGAPISLIEMQASGIRCIVSTSVTREIDCGGVVFLDLDSELWAKRISEMFKKYKNKRSEFDVSNFSINNFNKKLRKFYGID